MDEPPGQTSENKLKVMPIDDFQRLLEVCVDHTQAKTTEQTEIIHELQSNPSRTQPEESQQGLTNSKYNSSSLQSLNDKDKQGKHSKVSTATGASNRPAESHNTLKNVNHPAAVSSMNTVISTASASSVSYQNKTGRDSILSPSGGSLIDEDRKDRITLSNLRDREHSLNLGGKSDLQLDDRFTSVTSCLPSRISPSYFRESPDQSNYRLQSHSPPASAQSSVFSSSFSNARATSSFNKRSTPNHKNGSKKGRKQMAPLYAKDLVPNYRGDADDVDELVAFVQGNELKNDKRGPKKKEHEYRDKYGGAEGLGKSLSLDDDNLQLVAKKSTEKVRYSSLKDFEQSSRLERDKKETSDVNKPGSSMTSKKSVDNQSVRRESDLDDRSPVRDHVEPHFTVVRRKKKNKTASTTSPSDSADPGSSSRKNSRRSRSRGERRKSVGSVQGSDNSEGSDDGSVRSLPAGECTKRENIPKSCASSGGTPQTSYADIARLTREEEATKELQQTPEDYPSLHGSDNCEGSEDGSDLSAGGASSKTPGSKGFAGGPSLTSYAAIAKFASGRVEEKREDVRRETGQHEFPDLPATSESNETLPSPKSDVCSAVSHNNTSESAFPELTSNSLAKHLNSQAPVSIEKLVTNSSNADPGGKPKINSEPLNPSEAYQGSKAQMISTSPVQGIANHPANRDVHNMTTTNGFSYNPVGKRDPSTASFTASFSAVKSFVSNDVINQSVCGVDHVAVLDMNGVVVNGHRYEAENEKEFISDNTGVKFQRNLVNSSRPSHIHITTENDTEDGQCTEAVVFCGENFKEPPILPGSGLELEFGFEMKEVLLDFSKKTYGRGSSLDFTNNVSSEMEGVCQGNEFVQHNVVYSSQHHERTQDSREFRNLDQGDGLYNRARNHSFSHDGKYSVHNYSDDSNQGSKPNEFYGKNKRANSGFDKGLSQRSNNGKINKKSNQNMNIVLHDTTQVSSVATTILPVDGACNQSVPVVAAYSIPAIGSHPVNAIPTTVYGIQGYALSVPAGHSPYPNRGNAVQTIPTIVPVPMPPIFDGQVAQFPSPVSFIPAPVSASGRQPSPIISVSAKVQRYAIPEDINTAKSFEKAPRSDVTEEYFDSGYNPVPEHGISQPQQYEAGASVNVDPGKRGSVVASREILPVNFAQYYLPPDSSLYSQANMDGLRSYLEKREQECYLHSRQSSYSVRSLT